MGITYRPIDGEEVSAAWYPALIAMRRAGVVFRVNEGHRTIARQTFFWNEYRAGRGALAARPSPNAPHIRTGRSDHAIDFNNAAGAIGWLRAHGMAARLTVPGESWHVEVPVADLLRYARRHGAARPIRPGQSGPRVRWLQRRLRAKGFKSVAGPGRKGHGYFGDATARAVRRFQRAHRLKADGIVGESTRRALLR